MLRSCYPVLATADVPAARAFWTGPMGFEVVFDTDALREAARGAASGVLDALPLARRPRLTVRATPEQPGSKGVQ